MGQIGCQDSRVCNRMELIHHFSILLLIVVMVSDVMGQEDTPPGKEQLLTVGQVRTLVDNTIGKIFNQKRPTKVFTSMTVLNRMPVRTYTTPKPRKHVTTIRQFVTTRAPENNVVTVATSGEASVLDTLKDDEQFSTLVIALEKAGFNAEEINKISPLTVFAPTNSAFAKIDNATLTSLLEDKKSLSTVLLRHVIPGTALRIPAGQTGVESGTGDSLTIQRSLDDIYSESIVVRSTKGSAKITKLDINAKDGVIFA